jgi:hypothetical protein
VIELNDEEDEPSLLAMLRFCYDGVYSWFTLDYDHVDQHLTMYHSLTFTIFPTCVNRPRET